MMLLRTLVFSGFLMLLMNFALATTRNGTLYGRNTSHVDRPEFVVECKSKLCIDAALKIRKNMNLSVNPCDNFYQFACGGYLESAVVPDGSPFIDPFHEMYQSIVDELTMNLEEASPPDEPGPFRITKDYYKSCINMNKTAEKHLLLQIVKEAGGWPVIEGKEWNPDNFNWTKSLHVLLKMGISIPNIPFISVRQSMNDSSRAIFMSFELSLQTLALNADGSRNEISYKKIIDNAVALGADRNTAEKEFLDLFAFFVEWLNRVKNKYHDEIVFTTKVNKIDKKYPSISGEKFIRDQTAPFFRIRDNEKVFVTSPKYISKFQSRMNNATKKQQANFIMWNFIADSMDLLNLGNREEENILEREKGEMKSSAEENNNRREKCFNMVQKNMPIGLSALYVNKHFYINNKENSFEISKNILNQANYTLWQSNLDILIKKRFSKKLAGISFFIAYPDEYFEESIFEKLYEGLNIAPDHFLQNTFNSISFKEKREFSLLQELFDEENWLVNSHLYDLIPVPQFDDGMNLVYLPATFFRHFLNDYRNQKYLSYGSMGSLIGHEIFHGFDNSSRDFDVNGDTIDWNKSRKKIFSQKDQCLIDQYGNFSVGSTKLNGKKYLNENFADNGGWKNAYSAYLDWSKKRGETEPQLPDLPFNPRQMFWISLANTHCRKYKNDNDILLDDPHAPNEFRIIGGLSNIDAFANDFNCSVGYNMNPEAKCSTW